MIEVRWHGRGGQGAVLASRIVCYAAVKKGKYAQSFPAFGPERRGAPVVAFNRFDEKPILIRSEIEKPDIIVVLDPTLLVVNIFEGLKPNGIVVINTKKTPKEIKGLPDTAKIATLDAEKISLDVLGAPIVNTAMVGAFVKATEILELEPVIDVIRETFKGAAGDKNAKAASLAYENTKLWWNL